MLMATKIKTEKYSMEEFNAWTKFIGFGTRFDYTKFENRELVKRIEEAKFAQENPVVKTPSEKLESLKTDQGNIFSGIKSILNFF
jgi:hypothetical protein